MNFKNEKDMFDFTELPSAGGNYGYYGTNHLEKDYHKDIACGMLCVLDEVKSFKECALDDLFYDDTKTIRKIKLEIVETVLDELLETLCGEIAIHIVSFGDDEYVEKNKTKQEGEELEKHN